MIRVLVADDHAILRAALRRLLDAAPDVRVVAEAAHGDEVLPRVAAGGVDVVVLDISMPGRSFVDVLRLLRKEHPRTPAVVLSGHAEAEYAERALRAGAAGYVTKARTPDELLEAIRRAHRGLRYVSDSLAQRLAAQLGGAARSGHAQLSNREFQVLRSLARGRSLKEIAARLGLSPKTISTYRARTLEKLGLRTTADLIRYAVEQGLADEGR